MLEQAAESGHAYNSVYAIPHLHELYVGLTMIAALLWPGVYDGMPISLSFPRETGNLSSNLFDAVTDTANFEPQWTIRIAGGSQLSLVEVDICLPVWLQDNLCIWQCNCISVSSRLFYDIFSCSLAMALLLVLPFSRLDPFTWMSLA